MIPLNSRSRDILRILLQSREPMPARQIGERLKLTPRVVRYNLDAIESWLKERETQLVRKPRYGIGVEIDAGQREALVREIEALRSDAFLLGRDERIHLLVFYLLIHPEPVLVRSLQAYAGVSKTTILKDLDRVEGWMAERRLKLERRSGFGLQVQGDELDRRLGLESIIVDVLGNLALMRFFNAAGQGTSLGQRGVNTLQGEVYGFLDRLPLKEARAAILGAEVTLDARLSDRSHVGLILYLALTIDSIRAGRSIQGDNLPAYDLEHEREHTVVQAMVEQVGMACGQDLSELECSYLQMRLMGAPRRRTVMDIVGEGEPKRISPEVNSLVQEILRIASEHLHPYLMVDKELERSLGFDLKTALHRIRCGIVLDHEDVLQSRERFPYIHQVADRVGELLEEELERPIPEAEIDLVAMHLIAAMERLLAQGSRKRRVIVVCSEGLATAWLLVSRLKAEIPEIEVVEVMSLSEVEAGFTYRSDIDGMITTVHFTLSGFPVIQVSPMLTWEDQGAIRVGLDIGTGGVPERHNQDTPEGPGLASLLTVETVQLGVAAKDWPDAVQTSCQPLLNRGWIEQDYVTAISDLIRSKGPYMVVGSGIALLHARPEHGVHRVCMSLGAFSPPVPFAHPAHDPVDLVFVLGAVDGRLHLKALMQLVELLHRADVLATLRQVVDRNEAVRCIRDFLETLDGAAHSGVPDLAQ